MTRDHSKIFIGVVLATGLTLAGCSPAVTSVPSGDITIDSFTAVQKTDSTKLEVSFKWKLSNTSGIAYTCKFDSGSETDDLNQLVCGAVSSGNAQLTSDAYSKKGPYTATLTVLWQGKTAVKTVDFEIK